MSAACELDALLAALAQQAQHCRDFACLHGLERSSTRKLARQTIRSASHWRREAAAAASTLSNSRCDAAAPRIGSADTSGPPSADRSNDDASKSSRSVQVRALTARAGRRARGRRASLAPQHARAHGAELPRARAAQPREGDGVMALPARSKVKAEGVLTTKTSPTKDEASQAARQLRFISDDPEVSQEMRNEASRLSHALAATPNAEDSGRREVATAEATRWARMNV